MPVVGGALLIEAESIVVHSSAVSAGWLWSGRHLKCQAVAVG
jgi:hypothetical protein